MKIEFNLPLEISCGTLRPEDLIPRFRQFLKGAPNSSKLLKECKAWERGQFPEHLHILAGQELLEELDKQLNSIAPEGFYFGAHPGDGARFGFWEIEE